MNVECPSGLKGVIRKLKVKEENFLADRKKLRGGVAINEVLGGIWQQTDSPGPYVLENGADPNWAKVLVGDQLFTVVQMRIATYGKDFPFRTQCSNDNCGASFDWEIDLAEIPVRKLSDESKAIFKNGNRFETTIDGRKIQFRLLLAGEAQRGVLNARRNESDKFVTAALRLQVISVEGIGKARKELDAFIDDLDSDFADELREAFDNAGCGLETEIEVECPDCNGISEVEIPFAGDKRFFSRRRKQVTRNSS